MQKPVEREFYLMGTRFHIALFAADRNKGIQQTEELVRVVESVENQLSTWRPNSETSLLNRQPADQPVVVSPSLCELLHQLHYWVAFTGGSFDPACGKILRAWGIHEQGRIPTDNELQQALSNSGFDHLEIQNCTVRKRADVWLDVGAFGKGEALKQLLEIAKKKGLPRFLIDFGGQVLAWDPGPAAQGWKTALAHPMERTERTRIAVLLRSGSLSTSGGSERDQQVGAQRIGHIIDPQTGKPVPSFGSVTVWNEDPFAADILSTALYVMGPRKGYAWAIDHHIAACFLVSEPEEMKVLQTPLFQKLELTAQK
jgi:thiamine biosynthesis lipoprotein